MWQRLTHVFPNSTCSISVGQHHRRSQHAIHASNHSGGNLRTLQLQAYEAVWLCSSYGRRLAPLKVLSFTSESYKAIKEREDKKTYRRHPSGAEQKVDDSKRQNDDERFQSEPLVGAPSTSVETVNGIYPFECRDSQMALLSSHSDGITQPCEELQRELETPSTQRDIDFEGSVRSVNRSPSPSLPATGLSSGASWGSKPQEHKLCNPSATQILSSIGDSRAITPRDTDSFELSKHDQILNGIDLVETPLCPKSLGHTTESYKRASQGVTTIWEEKSHIIGGNASTRITVSREKYASRPRIHWTAEQEEKLPYVRDISQ